MHFRNKTYKYIIIVHLQQLIAKKKRLYNRASKEKEPDEKNNKKIGPNTIRSEKKLKK